MARLSVDVRGVDRFRFFEDAFRRGVALGLSELVQRIAELMRARCPVRTGETRSRIRAWYNHSRGLGVVVVAFPASIWWYKNITRRNPNVGAPGALAFARAHAEAILVRNIRREIAREFRGLQQEGAE